ncbi:hypothetical protein PQE75_gp121 [Bacillus phage vB_BcoS-136]|uniref:Uncharacterized protein n=1 Tax=Bacillus phage vB_BcoS-136 TaxID=2419619 RepID=A0A3G3BVS1_9CAUD|nr:hypothetical protein PQE75_gp121 [Bacillus phage vB_BcoS-136]AYP68358.1 hypothetical protein vBBcoS136_00244 [Bacillus phage vB_BcoS-136]
MNAFLRILFGSIGFAIIFSTIEDFGFNEFGLVLLGVVIIHSSQLIFRD